jgi:hypothetical protein
MSTHYTTIGQIARQHHHEMIAEASQRQLRSQARQARQARPAPAPRTPAMTRRLVAAIAKLGITSTQVPNAS